MNFLDPRLTEDGKPYAPFRYRELVRECYIITKNCNTSYTDVMNITPKEKNIILEIINSEAEKLKRLKEDLQDKN